MRMYSSMSFVDITELLLVVCSVSFVIILHVFIGVWAHLLFEAANVNGMYSI